MGLSLVQRREIEEWIERRDEIDLQRKFRKNFSLWSESLPSNLIRLQSVPLTVVAQTYGHSKRQIMGNIEKSNENPSALTSFYSA
jgi:hypothetical protein